MTKEAEHKYLISIVSEYESRVHHMIQNNIPREEDAFALVKWFLEFYQDETNIKLISSEEIKNQLCHEYLDGITGTVVKLTVEKVYYSPVNFAYPVKEVW